MAEKDKVPVVAIRLIVQMRSDEYHNYSYRAIAERIKQDFGIQVTQQAVGYLYRKNKDIFNENQNKKSHLDEQKIEPTEAKTEIKKPVFDFEKMKKSHEKTLKKFDNDDVNLDEFFE